MACVLLIFTGGALAEGFQERLTEFQSFERTFEVRTHCHQRHQGYHCLTIKLKRMKCLE